MIRDHDPGGRATMRALDEVALTRLAAQLAPRAVEGGVIYLEGELGAGKTTFARALLKALGSAERIKSPTYSLIESYRIGDLVAHHLDLYRIAHADELEWLGLAELAEPGALLLVEWPERGRSALPGADLTLRLGHSGMLRDVLATAENRHGRRLLSAWRTPLQEDAGQRVAEDF